MKFEIEPVENGYVVTHKEEAFCPKQYVFMSFEELVTHLAKGVGAQGWLESHDYAPNKISRCL